MIQYEISMEVESTLPYEQGYRDGLLTAKATLDSSALRWNQASGDYRSPDGAFGLLLDNFVEKLTTLIDQKNHDLWNLLAIAKADPPVPAEVEVLRAMLRAPSGLLVNSSGQVLFIRIKGTEYDTGVLALLEEVERLKAAEEELAAWKRSVLSASG